MELTGYKACGILCIMFMLIAGGADAAERVANGWLAITSARRAKEVTI